MDINNEKKWHYFSHNEIERCFVYQGDAFHWEFNPMNCFDTKEEAIKALKYRIFERCMKATNISDEVWTKRWL